MRPPTRGRSLRHPGDSGQSSGRPVDRRLGGRRQASSASTIRCSKSPGRPIERIASRSAHRSREPRPITPALDDQPFVFTLKTECSNPLKPSFAITSSCRFPLPRPSGSSCTGAGPSAPSSSGTGPPTAKGQPEWVDEPGSDARGIDLRRVSALVKALSQLETIRFAQYDGEIPPVHRA